MKKSVLITGGIRGIGLGIAKVFLQNNYRIVLNYRSDAVEANKAVKNLDSKDVVLIQADISLAEDRARLIEEAQEKVGVLDVLVNNAGILRMGRFLEIDESTFDEVMACNFYGALYLSQLFAKGLIDRGKPGAIVNITSVGAYGAANISYGTSKAALLYVTKCMAKELAKHNIRVNSVSPNMIPSDLNRMRSKDDLTVKFEAGLKKVPMKRAGTPEEIGSAVYFFATEASSYVTGRDLVVDGGFLL
jgi:3-oxoacyl-[acyl-carrier protein] reductase